MSFDGNINLYLGRTVLVKLDCDNILTGELDEDEGIILVDNEQVDPANIQDILYVDNLDMDSYGIKSGILTTPMGFVLDPEELTREVGAEFRYGEKIVAFECHLYFDPEYRKICIQDFKVTHAEHAVNVPALENTAALYRLDDGPFFHATLENNQLRTIDGTIPFEPERITEITICPQAGVEVTAILNDDQVISSLVASVSPKGIVLAEGYAGRLPYSKIRQLRYQSVMSQQQEKNGPKAFVCGNYPFRHRYLREPSAYSFKNGLKADFAVGMTSRGWICKDVNLAPFVDREETYGVLSEYINTMGYGYVSSDYEDGIESPHKYYLNSCVLSKGWNNLDIDTHRYLYVVKFAHIQNPNFDKRSVTSMEILNQYERSQYRSIHIDEQGNVQAIPFETPPDMTDPIEEGYGFLCFYDGNNKKNGNAYISLQVKRGQRSRDYRYYCSLASSVARYKNQSINTREFCYLVRYWTDKRQAKTDMLPLVYKIAIIDELPYGKDYFVNEKGEVYDYHSSRFALLDNLRNERLVVITRDNNRYLGTLQLNDTENEQISLSFPFMNAMSFHYSQIAEVWCLGKVTRYDPLGFSNTIHAGRSIMFNNNAVQSDKEPKLQPGDLVGFRLEWTKNDLYANPVRPLVEVYEQAYVVDSNDNGTYQVIPETIYRTEKQIDAIPKETIVVNPNIKFQDLQTKDYLVKMHSVSFLEGTPLYRSIEDSISSDSKIHFGYVKRFCESSYRVSYYTYGFLVPLKEEDRPQVPNTDVYFHFKQNQDFFAQAIEPGVNPNQDNYCLVAYIPRKDPRKNTDIAVDMKLLGRHPKPWFDQFSTNQQEPEVESEPSEPSVVASKSIQGQVHTLLMQNNVDAAKKLMEEYGKKDLFYYQQMNFICMKEYKHYHTQEVRLRWLDCLRKLYEFIDQTEQYGLRLDVLHKQATLSMEDGNVPEALALYQQWKVLLEEYCTIYPNKRKSYENYVNQVDRILCAEGHSNEAVSWDNEESFHSNVDIHAYLEWRLDTVDENDADSLWTKVSRLRENSSENEYQDALKAAVKAELAAIPPHQLRYKAHFAFLDLMLDPRCTTEALTPYFMDALRDHSIFSQILDPEAADPVHDTTASGCSQFTLDSVILFASGALDTKAWLARFQKEKPRQKYVQELCYLLDKQAGHFDAEQLESVFADTVAMLQHPVDSNLQFDQYVTKTKQWVDRLKTFGVTIPTEVNTVLQDLDNYSSRKGFIARMGCLRDNATKLQSYRRNIEKTPTVHDWNLLWPLCARLIRQIQRTWNELFRTYAPTIEFGSIRAVRQGDGTWMVTVPLRNRKNAQKASAIKIMNLNASPQNPVTLSGDGFERKFVFSLKPADPNTDQLTLDLEVRYEYLSDVQFRNEKYTLKNKKETVKKTVSVSCLAHSRQELSLDILNLLGNDAKRTYNVNSPTGKVVADILKNRTEELETIIGAISTGEKGSRTLMRDGRWVALYGQWRVGKSMILFEVSRALQGEEFGCQAIPVYVCMSEPPTGTGFEAHNIENICNALDVAQDSEVANLWQDYRDEWEIKHGEILTLRSLGLALSRFHQKIAPKTIVLALDEFTSIYLAIKVGNADVSFLRSFLDFIGQSGCIILTAGGEHTAKLGLDYDVNMLQKADCRLEVKYLSRTDTAKYVETVITIPSYLGNSAQKKRIINRIFELTQGNAFLLHKFCDALVRYVRESKNLVRIDDITIQETIDWIVKSESDAINTYFNSLYNPYNEIKGRVIEGFGDVRDLNLKILESIVDLAFSDTHSCRRENLFSAFAHEARFEEFLKTLIDRGVVKDDGGNISVPIDLYYEIQSRIKRKDDRNEY